MTAVCERGARVTGNVGTMKPGERATIVGIDGGDDVKRLRFYELGLVPGTEVTVNRRAPAGGAVEISLRGFRLSLRADDAEMIMTSDAAHPPRLRRPEWRPPRAGSAERGRGDGGVSGARRFALAGNPNCGKSTLFNALTGGERRVGNFPGVTVDVGVGVTRGGDEIVDLPGIYSLTPYSDDERLAVDEILNERPDCIINVVDATCPERGLYLTTQILELGIPIVVAFNMIDEVEKHGGSVDVDGIGNAFGVGAAAVSAARGVGVDRLLALAEAAANGGKAPRQARVSAGAATKSAESSVEDRYAFIDGVCRKCVRQMTIKPSSADAIALGKFTAYPLLFLLLACIFWLTFDVIGKRISGVLELLTEKFADAAATFLTNMNVAPLLVRLVCEGALAGVGAVVVFLPTIVSLFFFLAILEDTGYMARASFIMDAPMRKLGLSGKSVVPLLFGFGCSVPAMMAARTLPSKRDRETTVAVVPYMLCGAKIPVTAMLAGAFFPSRAGAVTAGFYACGIGIAVVYALVCKRLGGGADASQYMLELPPWRAPTVGNVCGIIKRRTREFLSRAFGVIFLSSVAVWAASTFTPTLTVAASEDESILAAVGEIAAHVFRPLGFGDWRAAAALVAGLSAKEAVVGTLAVLLGEGGAAGLFTPASALSFLTFALLYTPCAAAVSTMRRELGSARKTLAALLVNLAVAYTASALVYAVAGTFL